MAAAKTNGNTAANPLQDATETLAAFARETTEKLTELTEQARASQKRHSLVAIDSYEHAVLAVVDSYEKAATDPNAELTNFAGATRELTTAYTAAARRLVG
jgi:hypothetical protein